MEKKEEKKQEKTKTDEVKKEEKKQEKTKADEVKKVETKKTENKKEETKNKEEKKEPKFEKVATKQTAKKETKKKKTWIPSTIAVVVVIILVAILTVMIVKSTSPKKSVDGLLTNLKAGDFEKAQEFLSGELNLEESGFTTEVQALLFDKLSWKVTNVTEEENNATIELEITNKDFKTIINNCMEKSLNAAKEAIFNGGSISEEDFKNYFIEELKNDAIETTTVTKTINAVKEDEKWKIVSDDTLFDALLPNLEEAINTVG